MLHIPNDGHDPYYNLAFEEYVLKNLGTGETCVLLWQNEPAVIVGRFQNTHAEINPDFIRRRGIHVVRRITGGGAVYHDLGNLNFTFIEKKASGRPDFRRFMEPVAEALAKMGITAEISGRNDLTIKGKKFSGNAQYYDRKAIMHHGTLLFATDLEAVEAALRVKQDKLASKGVPSVRSRVTNISEHLAHPCTLAEFRDTLLTHLFQGKPFRQYRFNARQIAEVNRLRDEKYRTWEWNYGLSPQYNFQKSARFSGGEIEVCLQVENGLIQGCKLYGDFFSQKELGALERQLVGLRHEQGTVLAALRDAKAESYFEQVSTEELGELFFP